jgi:uncharacterized protein
VRFWDSSAIVPLIVTQASSDTMDAVSRGDPDMIVWWATEVECASVFARLERSGDIDRTGATAATESLARLAAAWQEIQPGSRLRQTAERLVRTHPIRAADALQLAAAIVASDDDPGSLPFVTLDDRQADAARREGFLVIPHE